MIPAVNVACAARQHGMGLVELMVAMVLGLLLALAALSSTLATSQLLRTMRSTASANENGQALINTLGQQIRAAGYVDLFEYDTAWQLTDAPIADLLAQAKPSLAGLRSLHGCDDTYDDKADLLLHDCATSLAQGDTAPLRSSLTVAYQVLAEPQGWSAYSLAVDFSDKKGNLGDCGGRSPKDSSDERLAGTVVINRYYLEKNRLMCIGSSNPLVPVQIAADVEQFQILYGVSGYLGNPAQQYLNASTVERANLWGNVVSVQICVLATGEVNSIPTSATGLNAAVNRDCNDQANATTEGRLRKAHRATVSLRLHK